MLKFLSREYRLVTHGASGERIPFEALLLHRYRNASSIIGMVEWYHDPLDPAAFVIVQDYDESDDSMDVSTLLNELFNESITRRGGNLKGLSIEYIQEIFYKTVYALKPLHEKGIIHGDVKGKKKTK